MSRFCLSTGLDGWRAEVVSVDLMPEGVQASGTQLGVDPVPYRLDYSLDAADNFITLSARVRRPKLGAPYYELRLRNGYVTGVVATRRLDRFLTYGVNDQRFARDIWYAVPRKLSGELLRLTVDLRPLRVTRAALAKSIGFRRTRCTQ